MLINLLARLDGTEVTAAFSGALLFTLVQHTFPGISRLLIFLVSFAIGIVGADTTLSLVRPFLPDGTLPGRETGAFICSALIVTVAMLVIGRVKRYMDDGQGHQS